MWWVAATRDSFVGVASSGPEPLAAAATPFGCYFAESESCVASTALMRHSMLGILGAQILSVPPCFDIDNNSRQCHGTQQ